MSYWFNVHTHTHTSRRFRSIKLLADSFIL